MQEKKKKKSSVIQKTKTEKVRPKDKPPSDPDFCPILQKKN